MKYQLGEVDVPTIVRNTGSGYPTYVLEFDSPPGVQIGNEYRTKYGPLTYSCDAGAFLALWVDGNTLHVKPINGWTPTNGHVIAGLAGNW